MDYTKMDTVVDMLKKAGWKQAGQITTNGGQITRIAGNRFVGTTSSTRERFAKGKERCTVGQRTTCFYEVGEGIGLNKCGKFRNHKTKDIQAIAEELKREVLR